MQKLIGTDKLNIRRVINQGREILKGDKLKHEKFKKI